MLTGSDVAVAVEAAISGRLEVADVQAVLGLRVRVDLIIALIFLF